MEILKTVAEFKAWRAAVDARRAGASVGFVPTMGALHAGHASLLNRSKDENEYTVLSIFVNPTQFNAPEDLEKYPRTLARDLELAHRIGVDAVFCPEAFDEIYPDGYQYQITEKSVSKTLEGERRPGHFEGMLTVVMKLLNLTRATRAYFGEKDYQQLVLVQGMAEAFFLETKIIACETLRERDGLAMSSRNRRLTDEERAVAPKLFAAMTRIADASEARAALEAEGFQVEYLQDEKIGNAPVRRLAAVSLGGVRLIDNVVVGTASGVSL
jgi:pantoate--beta-alanine ligase